jgi:hypothetical protein
MNIKTAIKHLLSTLLILLFMGEISAQEVTMTHKDSLTAMVEKYYELNLKVFQGGSNSNDIDKVFKIFTEDFTYVHPKYGGVYTRQDLYDGYIRNQENGGYNGEVVDIKVKNKIIGLNAAVVNRVYIRKEEGEIKEGEEQMTLFEFKKGKIFKIFEYW